MSLTQVCENSVKFVVERLTDWITLDAAVHQYISALDRVSNQLFERTAVIANIIGLKLKA